MSLFRTWVAMFCLVVLGALASAALGERVPLHGGFGFEGWSVYRPIVQDLPGHLREGRIDAYSIQRVLPFAAAHLTLRALGQPLDDAAILTFFAAWNLLVLGLGVWVWLLVAADHGLSPVGRWLGFLGLFAGFAVLKLAFYYPVNIDPTALLVGLAALLFYRRGTTAGLVLVSLAGLAVWPTTLPLHALLLLLPARARWPDAGRRLPGSLALVVALALAVVAVFARTWLLTDRRPDPGIAPAVTWALPLAHLAVAAWIVLGLAPLVGRIPLRPAAWWPTVRGGLTVAAAAAVGLLVAVHLLLTRVLAAPGEPRLTAAEFLTAYVNFGATTRPLQFLVAHAVYFGPVVLAAVLLWPDVARRLHALGAGLVAVGAYAVLMAVNAESRHLTNVLPMIVLPTVMALEARRPSRATLAVLAAAAFAFSKAWLPINRLAAASGVPMADFPLGAGDFQAFPAQLYFMSFGPWMSNGMLLLQGALAALLGAWLAGRLLYSRPS